VTINKDINSNFLNPIYTTHQKTIASQFPSVKGVGKVRITILSSNFNSNADQADQTDNNGSSSDSVFCENSGYSIPERNIRFEQSKPSE
jgi:hypothetical protein